MVILFIFTTKVIDDIIIQWKRSIWPYNGHFCKNSFNSILTWVFEMIAWKMTIRSQHLCHFCGKSWSDRHLFQIQILWYLRISHVWGLLNQNVGRSVTRRHNQIPGGYWYLEIQTGACSKLHLSRTQCFLRWLHKISMANFTSYLLPLPEIENFRSLGRFSFTFVSKNEVQILRKFPVLKSFGKFTPAMITPSLSKLLI